MSYLIFLIWLSPIHLKYRRVSEYLLVAVVDDGLSLYRSFLRVGISLSRPIIMGGSASRCLTLLTNHRVELVLQ